MKVSLWFLIEFYIAIFYWRSKRLDWFNCWVCLHSYKFWPLEFPDPDGAWSKKFFNGGTSTVYRIDCEKPEVWLYHKITNKIYSESQKHDFQIHEDQKPESNMFTNNRNSTQQKTENLAQLNEGEEWTFSIHVILHEICKIQQ